MTVHTEISSGPAASDDSDSEDEYAEASESPTNLTTTTRPFTLRQPSRGSDTSFGAIDDHSSSNHSSSNNNHPFGSLSTTPKDTRKQSIVSISTTISTRSEPLSPQPTKPFFTTAPAPEGLDAAYAHLGPTPYLRACLLLAQMSSTANLLTPEYTAATVAIARQNPDFVLGFIAQRCLNETPTDNFLTLTPGVKLLPQGTASAGDGLGQQYHSPAQVVGVGGSDIIIVGRGILDAQDRAGMAARYRREAWNAYEARVGARP
jgi:uridine monophosphate synthetase